jgi:hypothetical protein
VQSIGITYVFDLDSGYTRCSREDEPTIVCRLPELGVDCKVTELLRYAAFLAQHPMRKNDVPLTE